jgi:hypothetical protein
LDLLKGETDPRLRALADRAVGELAEIKARLGRYDELGQPFAELGSRDVRGPASGKLAGAREGFAVMRDEPERAFLCGPYGLDRILASVRQGYVRDAKIAAAKSTRRGTSMLQVLDLAESLGFKMQVARRSPGAPVVVPALVHWKAGHFAALTKESGGRLLMQDPTFGGDLWISRAALEEEGSGYFLMEILPPDRESFAFTGSVRSCFEVADAVPPRYEIGIEFLDMSSEARERLNGFVAWLAALPMT